MGGSDRVGAAAERKREVWCGCNLCTRQVLRGSRVSQEEGIVCSGVMLREV